MFGKSLKFMNCFHCRAKSSKNVPVKVFLNSNTMVLHLLHCFILPFQTFRNILMAASSNSMEVGVMGAERDTWTQWIVSDESRAELPLTDKRQDTLPVGLSLDTSATKPVPWEEKNLPPAPFLYLYSHHGVLCCFSVVNVRQGVQPLCQAAEGTLQDAAFKYFSKESTERGDKQVLQEQKVQVGFVVYPSSNISHCTRICSRIRDDNLKRTW